MAEYQNRWREDEDRIGRWEEPHWRRRWPEYRGGAYRGYGGEDYGLFGRREDWPGHGREIYGRDYYGGYGPGPYGAEYRGYGGDYGPGYERHYRGRGPRGYTRSDERIREDVNDRLTDDFWIDASEIEVGVSNGEVTLSGTVDNRGEKRRAEDIADDIAGVSHVQNNLRLQQSKPPRSIR